MWSGEVHINHMGLIFTMWRELCCGKKFAVPSVATIAI